MTINKNNNYFIITLEKNDIINRIDKFLSDNIYEFTRSYIQKLLKQNLIFIFDNNNNLINIDKNYKIKEYEKIYIKLPEKNNNKILFNKNMLDILYEDNYLIVINKIKGLVVHQSDSYNHFTLTDILEYFYKNNLSTIDISRPGIVHRLDKDTSGVLVIAKDNFTHNFFINLIQKHEMTRIYEAIIVGDLKYNQGIIDKPILRCVSNRKKMSVNPNGKSSITFYKVIKKYNNYTHVKFQLQTGRTHQIRIHMSSINNAILGDTIYGNKLLNKQFPTLIGQCLHAKELIFNHPLTKKKIHIKTELPKYFKEILNII